MATATSSLFAPSLQLKGISYHRIHCAATEQASSPGAPPCSFDFLDADNDVPPPPPYPADAGDTTSNDSDTDSSESAASDRCGSDDGASYEPFQVQEGSSPDDVASPSDTPWEPTAADNALDSHILAGGTDDSAVLEEEEDFEDEDEEDAYDYGDDEPYDYPTFDAHTASLESQKQHIEFERNQRRAEYTARMQREASMSYNDHRVALQLVMREAQRLHVKEAAAGRPHIDTESWHALADAAMDDFERYGHPTVQRNLSCMCIFSGVSGAREYGEHEEERQRRQANQHRTLHALRLQAARGGCPYFLKSPGVASLQVSDVL